MAEDDEAYSSKLDLSGQNLKKLTKALFSNTNINHLVIDENELQRLENIEHLTELQTLSATHNQLLRMYGVSRLTNLRTINLAHNGIVTIEGLRELTQLRWLSLAGNSIKNIEHLNTNQALEYLDLSENNISNISDLSYLKNLRELRLHGNKIQTLQFCERYLPISLRSLSLAGNQLTDLNDIAHLSHLANIEELRIANNPCVCMTGECVGFDYRPFVINWCMSLRSIDNYVVDAKESLRAEWLYSQGRGRQFRPGEQAALAEYLATVCPLSGESLRTEEEQKLLLILSKAQQHQRQLWEETTRTGVEKSSSASAVVNSNPTLPNSAESPGTPGTRQRQGSVKKHPSRPTSGLREHRRSLSGTDSPLSSSSYTVELPVTLYGTGPRSPRSNNCRGAPGSRLGLDVMAISADAAALAHTQEVPEVGTVEEMLMTRSLDPELLLMANGSKQTDHVRPTQLCTDNGDGTAASNTNPLKAASKLVPVPETIMSPDYRPATARHLPGSPEHNSRIAKPQQRAAAAAAATLYTSRNDKVIATKTPLINNSTLPTTNAVPNSCRNMSASWSPYAEKKHKANNDAGKASPSTPARNRLLTYNDRPWHKDAGVLKSPRRSAGMMSRSLSVEPGRRGSLHRPNAASIADKKSNTPSPTRRRCGGTGHGTATARLAHENDDSSDDSEMSVSKLETIRSLVVERKQRHDLHTPPVKAVPEPTPEKDTTATAAAVTIQRMWRGFHTRNLSRQGSTARQEMRATRVEDHVRHLTKELEATKAALETERKLRLLQMEAIKALWKEVQTLQPKSPRTPHAPGVGGGSNRDSGVDMSPLPSAATEGNTPVVCTTAMQQPVAPPCVVPPASGSAVLELSRTCAILQGQVQQLQDSLESVVRCMSSFCQLSAATQTVEGAADLIAKGAARRVPQVNKIVSTKEVPVVPPSPPSCHLETASTLGSEPSIHDVPSQTDITTLSSEACSNGGKNVSRSLLTIPPRNSVLANYASGSSGTNGKSRPSFLPIFHNGKLQQSPRPPNNPPRMMTTLSTRSSQRVPEQVHIFAKALVDNVVNAAIGKAQLIDVFNDVLANPESKNIEVNVSNKTG